MGRSLLVVFSLFGWIVIAGCSGDPKPEPPQPKPKPDPHAPSEKPLVIFDDIVAESDHVTEIYADDHARVWAVELHKGDSLPLHKVGPNITYALTDLNITLIEVHNDHTHDHEQTIAAGTVHGEDAGAYGVKNMADSEGRYVVFVRKDSDAFAASVPADSKPITEVTPAATELDSFDDFRAIHVKLPAGGEIGKHFALNRLIYALGDGSITLSDADGEANSHELKKGEVHFRAAGAGTIKNDGETAVEFLMIEMKR